MNFLNRLGVSLIQHFQGEYCLYFKPPTQKRSSEYEAKCLFAVISFSIFLFLFLKAY